MKCRKCLTSWIAATLIGALAVAVSPRLFGGGGDEGVDILPMLGGAPAPPTPPPGVGARIDIGSVRLRLIRGLKWDEDANWESSGVLAGPIGGAGGGEAGGSSSSGSHQPVVEVTAKGAKQISLARLNSSTHVDGRFEMLDLDPIYGDDVTLVGHWNQRAMAILIVGFRGTHIGPIPASFAYVDNVATAPVFTGMVDLKNLRKVLIEKLAGTARDVAIGIVIPDPAGAIQSWAAFNVDDLSALYDVDAKGR